ncbi:dynamin family protein [Paenibacillus hamazuiensis]|uniref:dynamin family protein n=1 Tax=Paenibacillus hamazuiensis TaxID=2936508 RepID=UPI00200C4281|nr:dynamin family protein [Paenibacillus hamazuiensis]
MRELDVISQIEQILQHSDIPKAYVQGDLEWMDKRVKTWTRSSWRIGVLGVTSSGKSTLINSLCGEEILPQEARPTSGVLVSCKKSPVRRATIIYKVGTTAQFTGEQLNKEVIADYADELKNPGNGKNVDEICLEFPDFLIGHDVEIVDSPGLDAFGLEGHEEIALRQLVPTVDLVLYVTTTKANSDKSNLNALNQIALEHKPVMVVQNFIDCVTSEVTSGGVVRRSVQEVEKRLRERMEKILQETDNKSLSRAPVFQISALEGLKSQGARLMDHWTQSRLQPLIDSLHAVCRQMEDQRSSRRLSQLLRHIDSMKERIQADLTTYHQDKGITSDVINRWDQLKKGIEVYIRNYDRKCEQVDRLFKDGRLLLNSRLGEIRKNWLLRDAESLAEHEIQAEAKKLKESAVKLQTDVFSSIDSSDAVEKRVLDILNLTYEDVRSHRRTFVQDDKVKIHKETKTKVTTSQRKKPSGFLWLKKAARFFTGESDYETVYEEEQIEVVNVRKTLEEFQAYVSLFDEQLASYVTSWKAEKEKRVHFIREEMARKNGVIAARANKPKDARVLESLLSRLGDIEEVWFGRAKQTAQEPAEMIIKAPVQEQPDLPLRTMRLSQDQLTYTQSLLSLAHRHKRAYAQAMIKKALVRHGNDPAAYNLWFFGRDELWMDQAFYSLFGTYPVGAASFNTFKQVKISTGSLPFQYAFLTTNDQIEGDFWKDGAAKPFGLIQLDIHQLGLTRKVLKGPLISKVLKNMPAVWMVQSLKEYLHDAGLSEAYKSYRELMEFASIPNPVCIVDHVNPIYTALFHTADQFMWHAGKGEEQEALSLLFTIFPQLDHADTRNEAGQFFKEVSSLLRVQN